jgi:hypothetical protein
MQEIRKIIAVLNDFTMIDEVLSKAFSFSNIHNAQVEILYVQETPLFEIPDLFTKENSKVLDTQTVKKEIEKMISKYNPQHTPVVFVHIGDTANRVWALAREDKETLIITAYHPELTEDIIHKVTQYVLVIKTKITTYNKVLLATDLEDGSSMCINNIKEIFNKQNIHLFYNYRYTQDPRVELELSNIQIIESAQKEAFEEIVKKHSLTGDFFVNEFLLDSELKTYFTQSKFDIIVTCCDDEIFLDDDKLWVRVLKNIDIDIMVVEK